MRPLVLVTLLALGACEARVAPPPAPAANQVWTKGYWRWQGGKYVWVGGHYQVRVGNRAWVDGHWEQRRGRHTWIPGHWR